jgi:hypothetical protein
VVEDPPRARGVSQVIQRRPSAKSATVLAVAPVWRLSDTPAGHGVPIRRPLHREMTTLTQSGSSSRVAPRSRRQRRGRCRLRALVVKIAQTGIIGRYSSREPHGLVPRVAGLLSVSIR